MTTPRETGWRDVITAVLQDAEGPLKYDAITRIIGAHGLRTLTGADPAGTVRGYLSHMTNPDHQWYDSRIQRLDGGFFQFEVPDYLASEPEPEEERH